MPELKPLWDYKKKQNRKVMKIVELQLATDRSTCSKEDLNDPTSVQMALMTRQHAQRVRT